MHKRFITIKFMWKIVYKSFLLKITPNTNWIK